MNTSLYTLAGWWFGTWLLFYILGIIIIPTDELLFFRGVGIPPTRKYLLKEFRFPKFIAVHQLVAGIII